MAIHRKQKRYTISVVAEKYELHQQTLRLYEREGLLTPSRSSGNTRLYTEDDIARLETILSLTRDLGVNLAGVAIILEMRERMDDMQQDFQRFVGALHEHLAAHLDDHAESSRHALVLRRPRKTEE